ncbi:APC family permease [Gordonia rhizosphera]|uniref:Putative amino acid transporter n=1 Tax=Gordonia rhizosphera NBRC 16068 TaxID=1108045 RepID=K6WDP2_9ACTN|nr:APC family permease [Gordonia rhizosphera]GAB91836.1 putative amino acid transporter [Gordonia rhizosphera NBRC 16068]
MSSGETIRGRSPVAGLRRAQLSFAEVLGQSVAAVAPSAVMVTVPALVIPAAGRWTVPVFVVTTVLFLAVGYCISQFSTRMIAVSGLYSYTVKGLGPTAGIGAGWSVVIGYAGAAMASTVGAAAYLTALLHRVGVPDGRATIGVLVVVVGAVALALMVRGIQLSARISLSIEVFAVVAAATVLTAAALRGDSPSPTGSLGDGAIGFALLLATTSFVGFESATTLAREARHPFIAVTRAVRWSPLVLGVLYVFAAVAQSGHTAPATTGTVPIVLNLPSSHGIGSGVLSVLLELGITASWMACVIGSCTALSRTLFAMGREGVVPAAMGRTHRTFHTPVTALLVVMPLVTLVPLIYLVAAGSARSTLIGMLAISAHGYICAYLLVCVAAPAFLRQIGELGRLPVIIGALAALALVAIIVWAALTIDAPVWIATATYAALVLGGFAVYALRRRRDPGLPARVGVFDETTSDQVINDYDPWQVRR